MDNKDNSQKFALSPKEEIYKKYLDKYYINRPIGTTDSYVGKIKDINMKIKKITLNPYFGLVYNEKYKKNLYQLINKDYDTFVDLSNIAFEPTTKKSILFNCGLNNKEILKASKSKSFFEKIKLAYKILTSR